MTVGRSPKSRGPLRSQRNRLLILMGVATLSITVLAANAAGPAMSHWVTPEEMAAREEVVDQRMRVGGRVVPDSIIEVAGRPVQFVVRGEDGGETLINYDGVVPGLFGPMAFVIVEGRAVSHSELNGDQVIIRHEDEFYADTPPEDSISRYYVPTPTADEESNDTDEAGTY